MMTMKLLRLFTFNFDLTYRFNSNFKFKIRVFCRSYIVTRVGNRDEYKTVSQLNMFQNPPSMVYSQVPTSPPFQYSVRAVQCHNEYILSELGINNPGLDTLRT